MTLRLLPFLLSLLLALPIFAQKKNAKPLIDMPLDEQLARVAREHAPFDKIIIHEADTVVFLHRRRIPRRTPAQLYDHIREALLETFGNVPASQIVTNGRDRLMFRTLSTVHGIHPTLAGHSDVTEIINIVVRGDTLYMMARFFDLVTTIEGFDGLGHSKTNTTRHKLGTFYPINPQKAATDPLASWNSIRPHYLDIYTHLRRLETAISNADQYIPE